MTNEIEAQKEPSVLSASQSTIESKRKELETDMCECGHTRLFHYHKRKTHQCDAIIFTPERYDNLDCECKGFKLKQSLGEKTK